ncbi:helicase DnaB [Paenibacillus lycopersici]|uniref:Helicase DnaB n=1 Tax=Paenibacillus lycopersici TaxID=2704462 RepID=A0A6C0FSA9_9BACL|nr:helicase DnaB [Paenibacillus lycopersici]QHT60036.1 helicase DnaB [Paenibacillus lycopersici]
MRIGNMHQFTEHHRYYTFRDFSLSAVDRKMIGLIYQSMIGAFAVGLYHLLYQQVADDRVGYSELEPQRKLLLGLGLEMHERGRQELVNQASRLEAVGLLQATRLGVPDNDDVVYEYEVVKPLSPDEFFNSPHLTLLLRDKVGKHSVIALRESFYSQESDELAGAELTREDITVPFYELFRLNTQGFDPELEQALTEVAPSRQAAPKQQPAETAGMQYGEIIMRFPRNSRNRQHVERLRGNDEAMAQLNYVAYKYSLSVVDVCRLLDEDHAFSPQGELQIDELQLRGNQMFRQDRKRQDERERLYGRMESLRADNAKEGAADEMPDEVGVLAEFYMDVPAQLAGRCDIHQYNMLMRNEPHTRFIARFFKGAVPDDFIRQFDKFDLNYRMQGAVINVLIHYVFGLLDADRLNRGIIDSIANNMLVQGVETFEQAVGYVRKQLQVDQDKERRRESGNAAPAGARRNGGSAAAAKGRRKPLIPMVPETTNGAALTDEEMEEIRRLTRKLDGK